MLVETGKPKKANKQTDTHTFIALEDRLDIPNLQSEIDIYEISALHFFYSIGNFYITLDRDNCIKIIFTLHNLSATQVLSIFTLHTLSATL